MMCRINKGILLSILILAISFFVGPVYSYAATATVQDASGAVSTTVDVPINITGVSGDITGVSIDVTYSTSVFSSCAGVITGTLTEGWTDVNNPQEGHFASNVFTANQPFSTDGEVYILRMVVKPDAPSGNTTIALNTCTLNDDEPSHVNGTFTVLVPGEPTGTITLTPDPASITADGSSTSAITSSAIKDYAGSNVPDGTKITVATDAGTITTADADGDTAGTQVATASGIITFTLKSDLTVGDAAVTAVSVAGDATGNTTVAFTAVPATGFVVSGITDPVTAGTSSDVVVKAVGAGGLTATGYTGTVHFTSSDSQAVLPSNYTFVGGDSGTKTFTNGVTLKTAGEQSVTATDTITATITGAQTGITVNPAAANKMTLSADKTTLASDGKGSAVLTATILDTFGNLVDDDTTQVTFDFTSYTYLTLAAPATVTATNGTAELTVTTAAGDVDPSPSTTVASITSSPALTAPVPQSLSIVNFSATSDYTALVTIGTPHEATITAVGATNYTWSKTSGNGTLVDNGDGTASFTAPTSITEGTTGHPTVIHVVDADNTSVTFDLTLTTYEPVSITWPTSAVGIASDDTTQGVTVTGGTGIYEFQSSNTAVANVDADGGGIAPEAVGTCNIQVRDATYGVFETENGFYAVSPQIEIVVPITVNPATKSVDASCSQTFTASGGKGGYIWTCSNADAGAIDATTGVFTAAAVTATKTATITATDGTYTDVKGTATVTVYAGMVISETPAGYVDGTPSTYPLMKLGKTTTLTAADNTRTYDWAVKDWDGRQIDTVSGATFDVDPDALFAVKGAGIYTVTLTDKDNPGLTATTLKVRVPMKFVATKFDGVEVKDAGNYNDTQGTDIYTIYGGPVTSVYTYSALDLSSVEVTDENCGSFADASPTDVDNVFTFTAGIDAMASFRVKVTLDSSSDDADVVRLIAAGLDTLWSGIFRVVPIVGYSGTVINAADEVTAVIGAAVTAIHDTTITATTAGDGSFTLPNLNKTGATYKFVVSKTGCIDKVVTGDEILAGNILLKALGVGSGTIAGTVSLSDGAAIGAISIQVKADTEYIKDSTGNIITVYANPADGTYTFPVPADYASATSYTVEAKKTGYIDNEKCEGFGVLTGVTLSGDPLVATGAGITLDPVTIITITGTAVDVESDGTNDQVLVKITAKSGGAGSLVFDNTGAGIKVLDANGLPEALDVFASEGANTWSFTHGTYEKFTVTVYADVSDDRDVDTDYKATKSWTYVKSATAPTTTVVTNPNTTGGTASSTNVDVTLPPGGLTGDILNSVTVAIVEADASDAGATTITGSEIVEVVMTDDSGGEVSNTDIQRIEITIKFNPTVVTEGTLEAGTYVIYQATSLANMVAGSATAVPTSQIILPIDYVNGAVTFWVNHLSAFGIGGAAGGGTSPSLSDSSGDSQCFIATAAYGSPFESHVKILRNFRDVYLLSTRLGHAFVDTYYKYSPNAAAFIADHDSLRAVTRVALLPVVGISYAALHTTAAQKMLITFLMLSLLVGSCLSVRRLKVRKTSI